MAVPTGSTPYYTVNQQDNPFLDGYYDPATGKVQLYTHIQTGSNYNPSIPSFMQTPTYTTSLGGTADVWRPDASSPLASLLTNENLQKYFGQGSVGRASSINVGDLTPEQKAALGISGVDNSYALYFTDPTKANWGANAVEKQSPADMWQSAAIPLAVATLGAGAIAAGLGGAGSAAGTGAGLTGAAEGAGSVGSAFGGTDLAGLTGTTGSLTGVGGLGGGSALDTAGAILGSGTSPIAGTGGLIGGASSLGGSGMGWLDTLSNLFGGGGGSTGGMGWTDWLNLAGKGAGAISQYLGSQNAVNAQENAQNQANALAAAMYAQNQKNQAPWLQAGTGAVNQLAGMMAPGGDLTKSFTLADYTADPGYQFRLQQGQQAIDRAAAARGNYLSPATLKALDVYNSGQASQEYQNAYNRYNQDQTTRFNRLASLAGLGQTAANQTGAYGQQYGTQVGQGLQNLGNVQAAQSMYGGNLLANLINQGIGTYTYKEGG